MNDKETREAQSLSRVRDFGSANAAAFPAGTLGAGKFAELNAVVIELDRHGSEQSHGKGAAKTSTGAKSDARKSLRRQMRAISDTAKAMESSVPNISNSFRVPTTNGDEALLNSARAFVVAATPLKLEFTRRELPESFLDDLNAAISQFESAVNSLNLNMEKRINATASIKNTLARGMQLKRELDAIVRNKFRGDRPRLAAWKSASRVERPPRRKKAESTAPPPPSTT
jgi:hypothetical protein